MSPIVTLVLGIIALVVIVSVTIKYAKKNKKGD